MSSSPFTRKPKSNFIYWKSIWSYQVAFAEAFSSMEVFNFNQQTGEPIGRTKVPVKIAPAEKVVSMIFQGDGDRPETDVKLPMISIDMAGIEPRRVDNRGQHQKRNLFVAYEDLDDDGKAETRKSVFDYQVIPYTATFNLTTWTKTQDHHWQLFENIAPYFNDDFTLCVHERGVGTTRDMVIRLRSHDYNPTFDLNENGRRIIQMNYVFEAEIVLYKEMFETPEIKTANVRVFTTPADPNKNNYHAQGFQATSTVISGWNTPNKIDDDILTFVSDFEDYDEKYLSYLNDCLEGSGECVPPDEIDAQSAEEWKQNESLIDDIDMSIIDAINNSNISDEEKALRIDSYIRSKELTHKEHRPEVNDRFPGEQFHNEFSKDRRYYLVDTYVDENGEIKSEAVKQWSDFEDGTLTDFGQTSGAPGKTLLQFDVKVPQWDGLVYLNPNPYDTIEGLENPWDEEEDENE